ncbi:MAG: transposase, partial [Spirochaetia bacterium]|nr:transposase [Spirochaetia bacterium]
ADAGYGSEENYDYLEEKEITGAIKYSTYEKEIKRSFKKKTFNPENWIAQKSKVKELLSTDEYKKLMKKRSTECGTVFGQIKSNQHFRRFHLRGNEKVATEWGLLMIGYDFR